MFFNRGEKKKKARGDKPSFFENPRRRSVVILPQPKGEFRNIFEEKGMIPERMKTKPSAGQKPDAPKSE